MPTTQLSVVDEDPAALEVLWRSLDVHGCPDSPVIRAVMIASVDGTTVVDGRSGPLGTPTDRLLYDAVRARADLVLVGSGTVLAEGYGPARPSPVWADRRQAPPPPVLVVSRALPDELVEYCAAAGEGLEIVVGPQTPDDRVAAARGRGVTVHVTAPGPLPLAVRRLAADLGAAEVAFEGGPRLLGAFLAAGAVDELILTTAPELIVGGDPTAVAEGPGPHRVPMRLAGAFTCPRGGLYTRWTVEGARG